MIIVIVRHRAKTPVRGDWLEMLDYPNIDDAARDAADWVAGEYEGEVMGAIEVNVAGNLVEDSNVRTDLWSRIRENLAERPDYQAANKLAQHEGDKHDRH